MSFLRRLLQRYSGSPEFWKNIISGLFHKKSGPPADRVAESYGDEKSQCFDLWNGDLNQNEGGAPVLVFFHGGGFIGGRRIYSALLRLAHGQGVTVISAGYRLSSSRKFTIEDSISDAARLVRFLKNNAGEYKIDPQRIAVSGNSAGGVMALSLAVNAQIHKGGENRVVCASCFNSPTFLDPLLFQEVMGLPSMEQFGYLWTKLFNVKSVKDLGSERVKAIVARCSPELQLGEESSPIYLKYAAVPPENGHSYDEPLGNILHSPLFGTKFSEVAKEKGVECYLAHPEKKLEMKQIDFILRHLEVETKV